MTMNCERPRRRTMNRLRCSVRLLSGVLALVPFQPGSLAAAPAPVPGPAAQGLPVPAQAHAPPPGAVARTADVLTLLNGDRLHGRLVGVDDRGVLTWQHQALLDPLRCPLTALDKVDLLPRPVAGVQHQQQLVRLVNGDRLCGDVVTLDATQLVLRTWYAGALTIARSRLAALTPTAEPLGALYDGPSADLAGWSLDEADQSAPGLAYRKGALVLPGGRKIGRKIDQLPDRARFDLELGSWQDADFSFNFFSDDPGGETGVAYGANFAGGGLDFRRMENAEHSLGNLDLSEQLAGRKRTRITILADRQERSFVLLLNGRLVREFRDRQAFKGKGNHLAFISNNATSLRIFRIAVSPWNGRLPTADDDGQAAAQDALVMANGDRLAGTLRAIALGRASFATSYGTLDVPLVHIAALRFARQPGLTNGTLRCWFNAQDAVTITLGKIADETIAGTAAGIGKLQLPLGAFTRLEGNPGLQHAADDDDEW